ncbi:MAG: hypothetical protein K2L72_04490, partial [Clostridia bacterium]|nr:hypothetical protein [Clostridia bacterium]
MLNTNTEFLRAEILDVLRLFDAENEEFTHYFSFGGGEYYNCIEYKGDFYDDKEVMETADELEFKRYAKRYAKLAFYKLLSREKGISLPYGALTG